MIRSRIQLSRLKALGSRIANSRWRNSVARRSGRKPGTLCPIPLYLAIWCSSSKAFFTIFEAKCSAWGKFEVLEAGADFVKIRYQNSNKELIENTLRADRDYLFVPVTFFKSRHRRCFDGYLSKMLSETTPVWTRPWNSRLGRGPCASESPAVWARSRSNATRRRVGLVSSRETWR